MSVDLIETGTGHVLELTVTYADGRTRWRLALVSGPPLTDEQWLRVRRAVVRDLIDQGCLVTKVWEGHVDE